MLFHLDLILHEIHTVGHLGQFSKISRNIAYKILLIQCRTARINPQLEHQVVLGQPGRNATDLKHVIIVDVGFLDLGLVVGGRVGEV